MHVSIYMYMFVFRGPSTCTVHIVCHMRRLWRRCVCVLWELSQVLWLWSTMLLLSRGDRSEPAVSRSRWMSAVWVKMCFCLLFLGDFHSALSRAHSPGQGAPLLPPCAGETWQMYLDMIHSGASEAGCDSPSRSLSLLLSGLNCILISEPGICS